jgi:hypothetical protein
VAFKHGELGPPREGEVPCSPEGQTAFRGVCSIVRSKELAALALEGLGKQGLILWAPKEAEHCSRLLGNLQSTMSDPDVLGEVLIACDRPVMTNLEDPDLVEDLWKTPLLQAKWRHIMADIVHLKEPALVTTGVQERLAVVAWGTSLFRVTSGAATAAAARP